MQSALVKLLGNSGAFGLTPESKLKTQIHPKDKLCLLVGAGEVITTKDGTVIEDNIIQANQTVIIKPEVELVSRRYHGIISMNPELALRGAIAAPLSVMVRPDEKDTIGLIVRTTKKLDLNELTHIFEIYQLD